MPESLLEAKSIPFLVYVWCCHNCGEAGMTEWLELCPDCNHTRCDDCTVEYKKGRDRSLKSSQPISEFSGLTIHDNSNDRPNPNSPALRKELIITSTMICRSFDPPSSSAVSPESTADSAGSSNLFSESDDSLSETAFESSETSPELGTLKPLARSEFSKEASYALDSCVTSVLGQDLDLADRLIALIHNYLRLRSFTTSPYNTTSPYQSSPDSAYGKSTPSTIASTPGSQGSFQGTPQRRHKRERDEPDDGRGRDGSRRRRTKQDDPSIKLPRFACHFFKKDPLAYCASKNKKYSKCPGPGWDELRHLKDHLIVAHRELLCVRCWTLFQAQKELDDHLQQDTRCQSRNRGVKTELCNSDIVDIERLCRVRRGMTDYEKQQHGPESWCSIWMVIFLDIPCKSPYYTDEDQESSLKHRLADVDEFLATLDRVIQLRVESGVLPRNDELHAEYRDAVRVVHKDLLGDVDPSPADRSLEPADDSENHDLPMSIPEFPNSGRMEPPQVEIRSTLEQHRPEPLAVSNLSTTPSEISNTTRDSMIYNESVNSGANASVRVYHSPNFSQVSSNSVPPAAPMNEKPENFLDSLLDFTTLADENTLQVEFDTFDNNFEYDEGIFDFDGQQHDNNFLTNMLETEVENPGATEEWKGNRDQHRNKGLPKL